MVIAPAPRIIRTAIAAVAVCTAVLAAQAVSATPAQSSIPASVSASAPAALTLRLGVTPAGRLTVVTANLAEYLDVRDNRQHEDVTNFARRLKLVLDAERRRHEPVHTPDLIFLQEVDAATAKVARARVSRVFGRSYRIAGSRTWLRPAAGRGAIVRYRTRSHALLTRATAVLYNTATMRPPSAARQIAFTYPRRQVWSARQCRHAPVDCQPNMWESRQSTIFRITAKRGHRTYAIASVHFVPYRFLRPRLRAGQRAGFREALWIKHLHTRMGRLYPRAQQIMAGDFNEHLCVDDSGHYGRPRCGGTPVTPLYGAVLSAPSYHWAIPSGIDHIFTQQRIIAAGKDTTYEQFDKVTQRRSAFLNAADYRTRFGRAQAFERCDAAYGRGAATTRRARAIPGCRTRYYSDHPFDWAVIG